MVLLSQCQCIFYVAREDKEIIVIYDIISSFLMSSIINMALCCFLY